MNDKAQAGFHIPSLDGIRGVAFLMVFAAHAGLESIVPGGFGVTIFFFLSGYLITTLMRLERTRTGAVSLKQFYLRRTVRILPPFYLVLGAAVLASHFGLLPGSLSARAVVAEALHFANYWIVGHGYEGLPAGTGVYWSLAVEEHFYLLFPCVFLVLERFVPERRNRAVALLVLCAMTLAWRCVLVYSHHAPEFRTYLASDTRVDSILFGCALALAGNPMIDGPSRLSDRGWKWLLVPASLVLLATFVIRDPRFRETFRYSLQGIALVPFFVTAIRFPGWGVYRALNVPAASFLGALSYSLYLLHQVVLDACGATPSWGRAALALGISMALAYAIHRLVEEPLGRLRKRLSASSRARAAPAASLPLPLNS